MNRSIWISLAVLVLLTMGAGLWWLTGEREQRPAAVDRDQASTAGRYRAGDFHLELVLDPPAPRSGRNELMITLRGPDDQPVTGAHIEGVAMMPAMGAMPEMRAQLDVEYVEGGRYRAAFQLSMDGEWPLTLTLSDPQLGEAQVSFEMATGRHGLQLSSGGERLDDDGATTDDTATAPPSGEALGSAITIDTRRRQLIGVQLGEAERRNLRRDIRAPGRITWDETGLQDITLRVDAWIGDLHANFIGMAVERGDELFTLYGPEMLSAQQDYLAAWRRESREAFGGDGLLDAAQRRLQLWGFSEQQIGQLRERDEPLDYVPVQAPRDGVVVDKAVVAGSAVQAGQTIMRIADLSRVWVEAQVYDADLALVHEGMQGRIRLPSLPGEQFEARVEFIHPEFQDASRTARIRLSLDNPQAMLRPDMYADVVLEADLGERLVVPEGAVLVAGEMRVVFVDLGGGRLQPIRVETGHRAEGYIEILEGLAAGDRVVTSGTFLVASESRLRGGLQQW